jgi:hypothetical protein
LASPAASIKGSSLAGRDGQGCRRDASQSIVFFKKENGGKKKQGTRKSMNHWEQAQKTPIVQEEDPSRSDIRKQVPPHWMPPPFSANTSSSVCVCVCSGVTRSESKSKTSFPFSPLDRQLVRFKGGRPIRLCQETTVSRPDSHLKSPRYQQEKGWYLEVRSVL